MRRKLGIRDGQSPRRGRIAGGLQIGWFLLLAGLATAAVAGIILGGAMSSGNQRMIAMGAVLLILGGLFAVLGVSSNSRFARLRAEMEALGRPSEMPSKPPTRVRPPGALPLLGELLVHKHHLISERDLARALARQRETRQRLGRVLVEMNLVKWPDLVRVLEDQVSYGDPWRRGRTGKQTPVSAFEGE